MATENNGIKAIRFEFVNSCLQTMIFWVIGHHNVRQSTDVFFAETGESDMSFFDYHKEKLTDHEVELILDDGEGFDARS